MTAHDFKANPIVNTVIGAVISAAILYGATRLTSPDLVLLQNNMVALVKSFNDFKENVERRAAKEAADRARTDEKAAKERRENRDEIIVIKTMLRMREERNK